MFKTLLIAGLALGLHGSTDPHPQTSDHATPNRRTWNIVIPEDYEYRFNAEHGDRLDLIMNPDESWVSRCLNHGGEPIWNPFTLIATCEHVDF